MADTAFCDACVELLAIVWLAMIAFGAAPSVIAVGAITIGVGFVANYLIGAADKLAGRTINHNQSNTNGTSSTVAQYMRKLGNSAVEKVHKNWHHLRHKMSGDYQELAF